MAPPIGFGGLNPQTGIPRPNPKPSQALRLLNIEYRNLIPRIHFKKVFTALLPDPDIAQASRYMEDLIRQTDGIVFRIGGASKQALLSYKVFSYLQVFLLLA